MQGRIDQALGGSNVVRGYTDQGSAGDPNYIAGGIGVNINRERFNDWGYPGSASWREQRQRDIAASAAAADRAAIDASKTTSVNATGKLTADINAPAGTRVSVEGDGLFKKTEVNRQIQMEPARTSAFDERWSRGVE
jgi:hypothetical protein